MYLVDTRMKRIILFLLALIALNSKTNPVSMVPKTDDKGIIKNKPVQPTISLLQGIWAENEEENAIFFIKGESLYYVEDQGTAVPIQLRNDTLIIYYDGLTTYDKILKLGSDSLILSNEFDEIIRLYKRK